MKEKELTLDIDGKDYKVTINTFSADQAVISVNGKKYVVGLKDLGIEQVSDIKPQPAPRSASSELAAPSAAPTAPKRKQAPSPIHRPKTIQDGSSIIAPLPGLIKKIHVREGDIIKVGQPIMILEAMKMENEVNSNADGMIIDIRYNEGDSVNQGDTLILLKPAEA